jgi:hypothetical protein
MEAEQKVSWVVLKISAAIGFGTGKHFLLSLSK